MENWTITDAQYTIDEKMPELGHQSIRANIDGVVMHVPISEGNRHYDEIMRQVAAGELTIADAE